VLFDNEMDCICFRNLNSNFIQTQIHTEKQSLPNSNITQIHVGAIHIQKQSLPNSITKTIGIKSLIKIKLVGIKSLS